MSPARRSTRGAVPVGAAPTAGVAGRARQSVGGRAVLGTLLVATAALSGYVAVRRAEHPATAAVVVAARDLAPGEALTSGDVRVERLTLPASLQQRVVDDPAQLEGVTVLGPVATGELLQVGALLRKAGGPASIEFSLPVDAAVAAGGRIRDADRVTVLATTGTGEQTETAELVRDALVAHVDRPERTLGDGRGTLVITLALERDVDAVLLAHAVATGKVAVVRTTGAPGHRTAGADPTGATAPTTPTLPAPTVSPGATSTDASARPGSAR